MEIAEITGTHNEESGLWNLILTWHWKQVKQVEISSKRLENEWKAKQGQSENGCESEVTSRNKTKKDVEGQDHPSPEGTLAHNSK